jgi:DeoR/GlpR family transcriptional regulator of sugar metabolism
VRGSTPPASAARSRANKAWTNRWMNASNPVRLQTLGPPLAQGLKGLLPHNVFLGAYGIDDDLDIVDPSSSMAQVKQQYVRHARNVVLLADSSKIGRIGNTKVMPLERVDILITDDEISPADRKCVAELDIDLIIADHT